MTILDILNGFELYSVFSIITYSQMIQCIKLSDKIGSTRSHTEFYNWGRSSSNAYFHFQRSVRGNSNASRLILNCKNTNLYAHSLFLSLYKKLIQRE